MRYTAVRREHNDLADRLVRALSLTTVFLSHPLPAPAAGRALVDVMGGALRLLGVAPDAPANTVAVPADAVAVREET